MENPLFRRLAAASATVIVLGLGLPGVAHAAGSFPPLNQKATAAHVAGKFIWADLFTSEPETAATFYCSLLGWTALPVEQNDKSYLVLSNGDHPVAGIVLRSAAAAKRPGVWIGYVSVPKVKSVLAAVETAGGTRHAPARNFPNRGTEAIFSDNEGAVVGILQSSSGDPADDEPNPGDWNWFELYSQNPAASGEFYRRVLGYLVHADDRPEKNDHLILANAGRARAGVAPLPVSPDSRPGWLGCVRVADIEAAAAQATKLGGKVLVEPRPASLGSRFAVVEDPTGGAIGLVQYVDNANPADHP